MDFETIKQCYEQYNRLKEQRLELDRQSARIKEEEIAAKDLLLCALEGSDGVVVSGTAVKVVLKTRPYIVDYSLLSNFVLDTGNTQVFNRALNIKALSELGDVPGVGYYTTSDIGTKKL
jgi:hypothetical protein